MNLSTSWEAADQLKNRMKMFSSWMLASAGMKSKQGALIFNMTGGHVSVTSIESGVVVSDRLSFRLFPAAACSTDRNPQTCWSLTGTLRGAASTQSFILKTRNRQNNKTRRRQILSFLWGYRWYCKACTRFARQTITDQAERILSVWDVITVSKRTEAEALILKTLVLSFPLHSG